MDQACSCTDDLYHCKFQLFNCVVHFVNLAGRGGQEKTRGIASSFVCRYLFVWILTYFCSFHRNGECRILMKYGRFHISTFTPALGVKWQSFMDKTTIFCWIYSRGCRTTVVRKRITSLELSIQNDVWDMDLNMGISNGQTDSSSVDAEKRDYILWSCGLWW